MVNLEELASAVRNDGYSEVNAEAKVCQDIVLKAISECFDTYIFQDPGMRETNLDDVLRRVKRTFSDRLYTRNIDRSRRANWMNVSVTEAFDRILSFLNSL